MKILLYAISCFRREVAGNCVLLGHYAASSGNFLPTFRDNLPVPILTFLFSNLEDGTGSLSRNVGKK